MQNSLVLKYFANILWYHAYHKRYFISTVHTMDRVIRFIQSYLLIFVLIGITAPFFFWGVGKGSLQPWDEAWYASISSELSHRLPLGNPWLLNFNQKPFLDHPPLGFQLEMISFWLFSESTFSARLPSVLAAILSVILAYSIAAKVSSRWAGLWAALILFSSRWFLFRARTGNLDVLLLATQLLVLLCIVQVLLHTKPIKLKKFTYKNFLRVNFPIWILWFSVGVSLLAKSLISLQLLPVVSLTTLWYAKKRNFITTKKELTLLFGFGLLAMLIPLTPWIVSNVMVSRWTFIQQQMNTGLRGETEKKVSLKIILKVLNYFHAAVHRWFKIMIGSSLLAILLMKNKKQRMVLFVLLVHTFFVALPYFLSKKTEIWHLVPIIGPAAILAGVAIDYGIAQIKQFVPISFLFSWVAKLAVTGVVVALTITSLRDYWSEFLSITPPPQDFEKITWHLEKKSLPLYVTSDAYFPSIVYYATLDHAEVRYLSDSDDIALCTQAIKDNQPIQAIARFGDWIMDRSGEKFVTAREGDLVLIEIPSEKCTEYIQDATARINQTRAL